MEQVKKSSKPIEIFMLDEKRRQKIRRRCEDALRKTNDEKIIEVAEILCVKTQ